MSNKLQAYKDILIGDARTKLVKFLFQKGQWLKDSEIISAGPLFVSIGAHKAFNFLVAPTPERDNALRLFRQTERNFVRDLPVSEQPVLLGGGSFMNEGTLIDIFQKLTDNGKSAKKSYVAYRGEILPPPSSLLSQFFSFFALTDSGALHYGLFKRGYQVTEGNLRWLVVQPFELLYRDDDTLCDKYTTCDSERLIPFPDLISTISVLQTKKLFFFFSLYSSAAFISNFLVH